MPTLYVVQRKDATGLVKVGSTKRLKQRLREIEKAHKCRLVLLRTEEVFAGIEPLVHACLKEWSAGIGREWFRPTPQVIGRLLAWPIRQFIQCAMTPRAKRYKLSRAELRKQHTAELAAARDERRRCWALVAEERRALARLGRIPAKMIDQGIAKRRVKVSWLADRFGVTRQAISLARRGKRRSRDLTSRFLSAFREFRLIKQKCRGYPTPSE